MPIYYPGWIMRVYYDLDDKDPIKQVMIILLFVIKIFGRFGFYIEIHSMNNK